MTSSVFRPLKHEDIATVASDKAKSTSTYNLIFFDITHYTEDKLFRKLRKKV